jgi:hypothetical protein
MSRLRAIHSDATDEALSSAQAQVQSEARLRMQIEREMGHLERTLESNEAAAASRVCVCVCCRVTHSL